MNYCQECGLPIPACNALARYRKAGDELLRGRIDVAKNFIRSAREFEEQFDRERREADASQ